ncbi:MAG TPA: hypothetical protein VKF38_16260 [Anaerolineaceae bacterium]|nr:hypothetical protein [Anaerolineaceae bacterium]
MIGKIDLSDREIHLEAAAEAAAANESLLLELLQGIAPENKKTQLRYNCFRILEIVSARHPDVLVPHWNFLVDLLKSRYDPSRYSALHIIANMVTAGKDGGFEAIFDLYFDLLEEDNLPLVAHLAGLAGKIALAKPRMQSRITEKLLSIDQTHFNNERNELIKGYAIESFDEYFEYAPDKEIIAAFVKDQIHSSSPKTRKKAADFLSKWSA